VNEQLREDISALLAFARTRISFDCPEWVALMRVSMALDTQPTTPEPAGETVRVTTEWLSGLAMQVVFSPDVVKEIQCAASDDMPGHRLLRAKAAAMECIERYAVNTLAMSLPRIPTVAARVVEATE
jgi:hypothetical protein